MYQYMFVDDEWSVTNQQPPTTANGPTTTTTTTATLKKTTSHMQRVHRHENAVEFPVDPRRLALHRALHLRPLGMFEDTWKPRARRDGKTGTLVRHQKCC